MIRILLLFVFFQPFLIVAQLDPKIQSLASEFWEWRIIHQPSTPDDINRVDRPDNWRPDFSPKTLESINRSYKSFRLRLDKLDKTGWSRSDSVDFLCLRSAIERVNWELNILRNPYRNPDFYVQQSLGAFYELLVMNVQFDRQRTANLLTVLKSIPETISAGKINLTESISPFAKIAVENLSGIRNKFFVVNEALKKEINQEFHSEFQHAFKDASAALEDFENWLIERLPGMNENFGIGRESYIYFLKNIALIPYSTDEILKYGKIEFDRSALFLTLEKLNNSNRPAQRIFNSIEEEISQVQKDEYAIREFLVENEILSIPEALYLQINAGLHGASDFHRRIK